MGEEYAVGGLMMASRANMQPGREPNGQAAATKEVRRRAPRWSVPDGRHEVSRNRVFLASLLELVL